jgi:hypothetical protein
VFELFGLLLPLPGEPPPLPGSASFAAASHYELHRFPLIVQKNTSGFFGGVGDYLNKKSQNTSLPSD